MQRPIIIADDETIHRILHEEIGKYGYNADLNHIDVSKVTNMSYMFQRSQFNGDISKWDVSKVMDMSHMFNNSEFNNDLSQWNVSKVSNMIGMFYKSLFNGDVSQWNVSQVDEMQSMFERSEFHGDLSNWVLHQGCNVYYMINGLKSPIAAPLLCVHSIESYQKKLARMFAGSENWSNVIAKNTGAITAHHGVALLLLPNSAPAIIHPELTEEDLQKIQMCYQLTGSVYQSSTTQ